MKNAVLILMAAAALCAARSARCEGTACSSEVVAVSLRLREQAVAAALAAPPPTDEADWQRRYDEAKARRGRGMRQCFTGVGVSLASLLLAGKSPSVAVAGTLVGGVYGGIGGYHSIKATAMIDELREEGARKGYYQIRTTNLLELGPAPGGGAQFRVSLAF